MSITHTLQTPFHTLTVQTHKQHIRNDCIRVKTPRILPNPPTPPPPHSTPPPSFSSQTCQPVSRHLRCETLYR
jgi:hypothetical protein